jgi:hypothetical protein
MGGFIIPYKLLRQIWIKLEIRQRLPRGRLTKRMPSVSAAQQIAMAIAEHDPKKLFKRNKGLLKMTHGQLHDFAKTKRSKLPYKVDNKK